VEDVERCELRKLRVLNASHQALGSFAFLDGYKATLIERFSNPEVRDTVARLCAESSDRIQKWLLPVI